MLFLSISLLGALFLERPALRNNFLSLYIQFRTLVAGRMPIFFRMNKSTVFGGSTKRGGPDPAMMGALSSAENFIPAFWSCATTLAQVRGCHNAKSFSESAAPPVPPFSSGLFLQTSVNNFLTSLFVEVTLLAAQIHVSHDIIIIIIIIRIKLQSSELLISKKQLVAES